MQLVSVSSVKKTPRKQKVMLMKKREGRVILLLGGALGNVSHTHIQRIGGTVGVTTFLHYSRLLNIFEILYLTFSNLTI